MSIDVSVIVPVYNPGPYIEACIDGLLSQSLPRDRLEIFFIDDGSTDETPARLDRLAAEHPHIRVVHQPNSGWPGQPRNLGIDSTTGDYVFFSDHDDVLGVEALERMVEFARRNNSDVLVPKMVSLGRPVPRRLFRANIDGAPFADNLLLLQSLSPHKMFRRGFLLEHNLRFPEGKRRLEDEVFVTEAYFLAKVISVLADYPCYYRVGRDDGGNNALATWEPTDYFGYLAETIDIIDAHTEPGAFRNALYVRPYAGKMLNKLSEKRMATWPVEQRQKIFDASRDLAMTRFPPDFQESLQVARRVQGRSLIANRLDLMIDLASRTAAVTARVALLNFTWRRDKWVAEVEAELRHADGSPILITPDGDGWVIDPRLIPSELAGRPFEQTEIMQGHADVVLRDRAEGVEWYAASGINQELVPIPGDPHNAHRLVFHGNAHLNLNTLAGGSPLPPGRWDVRVRVAAFGLERVGVLDAAAIKASPALSQSEVAAGGSVAIPKLTKKKQGLWFAIKPQRDLGRMIAMHVRNLALDASKDLVADIDMKMDSDTLATRPPRLVLLFLDQDGAMVARRRGRVTLTDDAATMRCSISAKDRLPRGRYRVAVKVKRQRALLLGVVEVGALGRVTSLKHRPPKLVPIRRRGLKRRTAGEG